MPTEEAEMPEVCKIQIWRGVDADLRDAETQKVCLVQIGWGGDANLCLSEIVRGGDAESVFDLDLEGWRCRQCVVNVSHKKDEMLKFTKI